MTITVPELDQRLQAMTDAFRTAIRDGDLDSAAAATAELDDLLDQRNTLQPQ